MSTILTSVTGYFFPFAKGLTPAHIVGAISLAIPLAVALFALYGQEAPPVPGERSMSSPPLAALWLNFFVAIVQSFGKFAYLNKFAPTGSEPPFAVTQGIIFLILFIIPSVSPPCVPLPSSRLPSASTSSIAAMRPRPISPAGHRASTKARQCFVTNCYLIKHSQGWMMWDTGLDDAVADDAGRPAPGRSRAIHWRKSKKLSAQLLELGVKPAEIKYVAISHSHGDHIGNVRLFPQSMLLVQRAEYDWPAAGGPRFKPELPVTKIEGDRDVFGDGSVVILSTPGHTPGHQALLIKLPKTGGPAAVGRRGAFPGQLGPSPRAWFNTDKEQSSASMQRIADIRGRKTQF